MSTPGSQVFGQQDVATATHDYNVMAFVFGVLMQNIQTATLVKVVSCTNSGGVSPIGTCTVQPLVNQMTGNRESVPHGELFNCLYSRLVGGTNAIIMDPQPGDIGLMGFCSRDISGVRANEGQANPGSFRMFDWADGIYVMGVPLGVTPEQYIAFAAGGITVESPTQVQVTVGDTTITATTDSLTLTAGGKTVTIDSSGVTIDGILFETHTHSGVQTGGGNTGPPNP